MMNNYYPFGMAQTGRNLDGSNGNYRYGYNGKEEDNEIKTNNGDNGKSLDYGARRYDPRKARCDAVEASISSYPSLSPFILTADNPIVYKEIDGKDFQIVSAELKNGRLTIHIKFTGVIVNLSGQNIDAESLRKTSESQMESNYSKDFTLFRKSQASELSKALGLTIPKNVVVSVKMDAVVRIAASPTDIAKDEHKINVYNDKQWITPPTDGGLGHVGSEAATEFLGDDMDVKESKIQSMTTSSLFTHEMGHWLGLPHWGSSLSEDIGMKKDEPYPSLRNDFANLYNAMHSGNQARELGVWGENFEIATHQFIRLIVNIKGNKDNQKESVLSTEQKFNNRD